MTKEIIPTHETELKGFNKEELTEKGEARREFLEETSKKVRGLAVLTTLGYLRFKLLPFITTANAAELSNPEQEKLQEKFASNCTKLEIDIKNSDEMPLQPIDEWSELMNLVKKQREANSLTADEKSRMNELQKKEREAMGKFVSVGTGPNSSEWKKLEETTEEINKLTLVVISTIQDAYALATGKTPKEIKDNVWVKHPKEDRMVFNKAYFEKLAEDTKGDKNFARLLQTGGIVDELFKRYEMFFRMTDWKRLEQKERERIVRALDNGYPGPDKRKNKGLSSVSLRNPADLFNKKWDEVRFESVSSEDSKKLVMNYRMSNLLDIHHLFRNLISERNDDFISEAVQTNYVARKNAYHIFSKYKYNYKTN